MRLSLLACVLFLVSATVSAAPPRRTAAPGVYPADIIGYVTEKQVRAAQGEGLPVGNLDARQRQLLPKTAATTRIRFFKKSKGRYGILLTAPRSVEEYKP